MTMNKMRPIHPGEILREEYLVPLGLSVDNLAQALDLSPVCINEILEEHRGLTGDTALRLAQYFGTDAQSWMNLQLGYDLRKAELEVGELIRSKIKPRQTDSVAHKFQ